MPLEKDAHLLIADHLRKDAHPDSYSWQYITDSIEHGVAQLTDRYRIFGHPETGTSRPGTSAPTKHTRTPFSAADDAALANWVLSHSKDRTGNKIFQEFAETVSSYPYFFSPSLFFCDEKSHADKTKHSWHTWQSWRNRFIKNLAIRPLSDLEKLAMSAADLAVQSTETHTRPASNHATPKQQNITPTKAARTPKKTPTKQPSRTPQRDAIASPSTSPDATRDKITTRSATRQGQQSESMPTSPTKSSDSEDDDEVRMIRGFYADLTEFVDATGADIDAEPCIDGKIVDLYELGKAVGKQKVPLEEVDWMKAAEDLEFDWVETPTVTAELRQCYEDNLAAFFEAMSSFSSHPDGEHEDEQHSGPLSPESDLPSSPPVRQSNQKRHLDDHHFPLGRNTTKRRRLSRNAEIPSTPEERIGVLTTQSPSVVKAIQLQQAHGSSNRIAASLKLPDAIDDEEEEGDEVVFETQVRQIRRMDTQQSAVDVTPSQQLHSEALDASPVPLNLKKGRGDTVEQQALDSELPKSTNTPGTKAKTTSRAPKRSLPASFAPAPGRFSPQQAEERARRPSAPVRIDPDEEGHSQDIRDCTEYYESLGYSRPIVIEALMRTTMTPGWPTSLLLEKLQNKEGVPTNYEGIWTDRDDKSLQYADKIKAHESTASTRERNKAKKELDRIVHKHTQEAVDLRRKFLQAQADMETR